MRLVATHSRAKRLTEASIVGRVNIKGRSHPVRLVDSLPAANPLEFQHHDIDVFVVRDGQVFILKTISPMQSLLVGSLLTLADNAYVESVCDEEEKSEFPRLAC